jgi:hypothetical protein
MLAQAGAFACVLVCGSVAAGCGPAGGAAEDPVAAEGWQLVARSYPYRGEAGETVCAEWKRREASGRTAVQYEFYHLEEMNAALLETSSLASGVRNALRARVPRVKSCDDAREFTRVQAATLEAVPSKIAVQAPAAGTEILPDGTEPVDKIANGVAALAASSVSVWRWVGNLNWTICSGALLDRYRLLTAAHCFPANGSYTVWVDFGYPAPAGMPLCLNPPCDDPTTGTPKKNVIVTRYPGFLGSNDPSRDLAIVTFGNGGWVSPGNVPANWTALAATPISVFWLVGYGANDYPFANYGVSRRANGADSVDWYGDEYWLTYTEAGIGRPCKGDSGAPAFFTGAGFNMAVGFMSGADTAAGDSCPRPGEKFRYTRIETKLSWIESVIGRCGRFIDSGYPNMRCN